MQRACTCAFKRALSASPDVIAQRAASRTSNSTPITSRCRRSFSAISACQYPRQATPFSSSKVSDGNAGSDAAVSEEAASSTSSGGVNGQASTSSSKSAPSAWYLSEAPPTPSTSTSSSTSSTSRAPKEIPTPPSTLPHYLRPLWDHLYESPFLDQHTINFIDSNAVQENVSEQNMDASVSSWVDWVVVASLRRGRERGIRGASEGAKIAMKECLKVFDEQLAAAEQASNSASGLPASIHSKRKNKIPKVLVEGLEIRDPQWCLIDGGKAVIHIMTSNARRTWQVEGVASGFAEVRRDAQRIGEELEEQQEEFEEAEEDIDEDHDTVHASEIGKEIEAFERDMPNSEKKAEEFQPRMLHK